MTIITKPLSEKKSEKLVPLVENDQLATAPPKEDVEAQSIDNARFVILRARAHRVSSTTTLTLLLTALVVVGTGIISGTYLYRQYLREQMHRFNGWCVIPYNDAKTALPITRNFDGNTELTDSDLFRAIKSDNKQFNQDISNYFQEEFELDLDNENYEKINVPDFREGRGGRFIHDFNTNITGIIDVTGKRCFVMPLNRSMVLPPRSLYDLIHKMWDGYYKVDTEVVRENMHVVMPPISDRKDIGGYITKECDGLPIYKLEKFIGGVVKRSAILENEAKFAQFSGIGIMEIDIMNLGEARAFEEHLKTA